MSTIRLRSEAENHCGDAHAELRVYSIAHSLEVCSGISNLWSPTPCPLANNNTNLWRLCYLLRLRSTWFTLKHLVLAISLSYSRGNWGSEVWVSQGRELGNISSGHAFRDRGLHAKPYHCDMPDGAAAGGNHLEVSAAPSWEWAFQQGPWLPEGEERDRPGVWAASRYRSATPCHSLRPQALSIGDQDQILLLFHTSTTGRSRPRPLQLAVLRLRFPKGTWTVPVWL